MLIVMMPSTSSSNLSRWADRWNGNILPGNRADAQHCTTEQSVFGGRSSSAVTVPAGTPLLLVSRGVSQHHDRLPCHRHEWLLLALNCR